MNQSILVTVSHTAGLSEDERDTDGTDRSLSASGFVVNSWKGNSRSLIISSASWLSSLLDIRIDGLGGITWTWKNLPPPEFIVLYGGDQDINSVSIKFVGVFLMSSVLSSLKEALSSLLQWRSAVSGPQHSNCETKESLPLYQLLLPLACAIVFEANTLPATDRITELCSRSLSVSSHILVLATPFASYCPEVFLSSFLSGCVSKVLDSSGNVYLADANTLPGCEGGMIVHGQCSRSTPKSVSRVCGMVLSTLTSERGQPTGLSLACSASAIAEALQQVKSTSSSDHKIGDNHIVLSSLERPSSPCLRKLEKVIVLIRTTAGWGTGIRLTPAHVITCQHVIHNSQDLMVHESIILRTAVKATTVWSSTVPDLAVLKLEKPFRCDHLDTKRLLSEPTPSRNYELYEGNEVIVIGYGLQHSVAKPNGSLVSRGVVSKVVHDQDQPVLFVTTAAVYPGMSGGLVVSVRTGELLGMVVSNSQVEENGAMYRYPKLNYCLPFSWLLPALASYVSDGDILTMDQLADQGQKIKHLWRLQTNLNIHPTMDNLRTTPISSKL